MSCTAIEEREGAPVIIDDDEDPQGENPCLPPEVAALLRSGAHVVVYPPYLGTGE
jgi:hypothetical protein